MKYTIQPICAGLYHNFEKSRFTFDHNHGVKIDAPLIIWVVRGPSGVVIVDSGPPLSSEHAMKHHIQMDSEYSSVAEALKKNDVDPLEIKKVVITHLHWDHCYNLELFPNAMIYSQRKEMQYAIAPLNIHKITYETNLKCVIPAWTKHIDRFEILDGDCELQEGLEIYSLTGHTMGLQGVCVDTTQGRILLGSDAFPMFENYEESLAPGIHVNLEDCFASIKKTHKICDSILPAHDLRALDKRIYGL